MLPSPQISPRYPLVHPKLATPSSSIMSSNKSFPYSETSINSCKSRKNVLYPRRPHPSPITVLPCMGSADMLTWEVRYLCANLLPRSETRLSPAGAVLLRSLGQERDLSEQRKNEEICHCAELFILLIREVHLKGAIGVEELEAPCKLLDLTFRAILFKSGARVFGTPMTSDLDEIGLRATCVETQGPERFTSVLRALCSVMDAFEVALYMISPPAVGDEVLCRRVLLGFSTVKDLKVDQYRKDLGLKLVLTHTFRSPILRVKRPWKRQQFACRISPRDLPRDELESISAEAKVKSPHRMAMIEEGTECNDEGNSMNTKEQSCGGHMIGKYCFPCKL